MKTILIAGGGTGGIITTSILNKTIGDKVKIILFEKEEKNVFAPSLLWLMNGKRKPQQIYRNIRNLERKRIEVVLGNIEKINPEENSIIVNNKEYKGDFTVVSLGTEYETVYELEQYGYNFYTLDGAVSFYEKLKNFNGGKIAVLVSSLPFKCPAAPYEAAMLTESYLRSKGLKDKTELFLFTPEPQPMPVTGKETGLKVKMLLEQKGIKYFTEHQISSVNQNTITFTNGKTEEYNLLAFTPKHVCPEVIRKSALMRKSGWIEVDRNTMETGFPNVLAAGDNTFIPLESGKPLPKAGVFAHYQAEAAAYTIAGRIYNNHEKYSNKKFNGYGQCFLETGDGKAGYASGNFYASPVPEVRMKSPGLRWHWMKVWFEKYWFLKYF